MVQYSNCVRVVMIHNLAAIQGQCTGDEFRYFEMLTVIQTAPIWEYELRVPYYLSKFISK